MSYYPETQLMSGEIIVSRARPTLWSYWFMLVIGLIGLVLASQEVSSIFLTVVAIVWVYLSFRSQQLALTNKRIIGKYGLIARTIVDVPLSHISSVSTEQSFFGRILGYGSVATRSAGGEKTLTPLITKPNDFRGLVSQQLIK